MDAIQADADRLDRDDTLAEQFVQAFAWSWNYFEQGLLPLENGQAMETMEKIGRYALQFFTHVLPGVILIAATLPLATITLMFREVRPYVFTGKIEHIPEIGVSTAEYQVNGAKNHPNSTWARLEDTLNLSLEERSGTAVDHWHNMDAVIDRLKGLNLKHYRFSVEWSMIEPEQGVYNDLALQHYVDFCKKLQAAGIVPLVTLHHFSLPTWFADLGEFENEENIDLFVNFSERVFRALNPYVKQWSTINEPGIFKFCGYDLSMFPPCKSDIALGGLVLKHLMMAHCRVYDRLKPIDHDSQIGISHNIMRMRPYHTLNPIEQLATHYTTRMVHEAVLHFFKTGEFRYQMPLMANIAFDEPDIAKKFDFFGLQYYSDPLIGMEFSSKVMASTCYPHEKMTDMEYRFYPEGLATALEACRSMNKPIFITETGIASSEPDRVEFFQKIFEVVSRAIANGIDVQQVFIWSLEDNYEWREGWHKKFGLYSFDHLTKEFEVRDAGKWVKALIESAQREIA
jgi:beta-glucosidase